MILDGIKLVKYSKGEEVFNSITHGAGSIFGFVALIACLYKTIGIGEGMMIFSALVYGLSMFVLYSSSTVYHAFPRGKAKKVLRLIDHSMIYVLIAGTITPIALVVLLPVSPLHAGLLLFFAWGGLLVGILATVFSFEKTKILQMTLYIGIGWVSLIAVRPLINVFHKMGFILVLAGGIVYTLGAIFYGLGSKIKYMHGAFHLFVLLGSILHFAAIFQYVFI